VEPTDAARWKVTGDLTIHGVTKPVVLDTRFLGQGVHPFSKKVSAAFRAETAVITISDPAVDFPVQYGAGLFPGTPIVVGSTEPRGIRNWPLPPGITGAVGTVQFKTTLELALALHPGTRRVVVAAGSSMVDRHWAEQTFRDLRQIAPDVEIIDTRHLPAAELLQQVASQPRHTVIVYHAIFRDGAGELFVPGHLLTAITRVANAPVYGHTGPPPFADSRDMAAIIRGGDGYNRLPHYV
jgi:hypothetical protein